MKEMKYSKEIKIGLFAILILVATFFTINYLRGKDVFNREIELVAHFKTADGLVASAPVQIKGFAAGSVSSITYNRDTDDFEVVCSVKKEFRIPADSRMTIYSTSIMGGKGIRIDCGTSEELAEDGSELESASEADLVETVSASIGPLMAKLDDALSKLGLTIDSLNEVLSEENRRSINRTLADLRKVMADASSITGSVNGKTGEIDRFISELTDISGKLSSVAEKADSAMTGIDAFADQLRRSEIDSLVFSVRNLSESIQNPEGTVGKLLNDGNVYESVDSLVNQLNDLVQKIKENPKKYMKISVF